MRHRQPPPDSPNFPQTPWPTDDKHSFYVDKCSNGREMSPGSETDRVRKLQDKAAPHYDRQISFFERVLFTGGRQWATSKAEGDVLEIAAGTGRNFRHYARQSRVTGIELSEEMLAIARGRAERAAAAITVIQADAQELPFEAESFDTVLITLALCTIPDDRAAVREARRVLRPSGRLVLLEHVRSPLRRVRVVQRLLEPLTVRFEGDHLLRDPLDYLAEEGFEVESARRLKLGIVERVVAHKAPDSAPLESASTREP